MRNVALAFLALAGLVAVPASADAQMAMFNRPWDHNLVVTVGFGGEAGDSSIVETFDFTLYNEQARIATAQNYGAGFLFNLGGGYRVWRNLVIGGTFTRVGGDSGSALAGTIPNPVITGGAARQITAADETLSHTETGFHVSATWMIPVNDKIDVGVSFGPSFYSVSHQFVGALTPESIVETPPNYESVSIGSFPALEDSGGAAGVHFGVDATYSLPWDIPGFTELGGTGFFRYAAATAELNGVSGPVDVKAGGAQIGVGVRLLFDRK
jgi:hypothetical protein